jgi:hypothetical protein
MREGIYRSRNAQRNIWRNTCRNSQRNLTSSPGRVTGEAVVLLDWLQ